jgi:hypothetical protein
MMQLVPWNGGLEIAPPLKKCCGTSGCWCTKVADRVCNKDVRPQIPPGTRSVHDGRVDAIGRLSSGQHAMTKQLVGPWHSGCLLSSNIVAVNVVQPSASMYSHGYTSNSCIAPDSSSHFRPDPEQSVWPFDHISAEPHPSRTNVGCAPYRSEPLHSVNDPYISPQALDPRSLNHTEPMRSGRDWALGTCWPEGDQPGLETLSSQPAQPLAPSPNSWLSGYSNETMYSDVWATGDSGYRVELPALELGHLEFAMGLSFDTRSFDLSTSDIINDVAYNEMVDLGERNDTRCLNKWIEDRGDPARLGVGDTSTGGSEPHTQRSAKPYVCPLVECSSQFLHYSDLCRHRRTVHMRRESGQGYRCAFEECPKADKIWTRLDSFKQHVLKRHQSADVNDIVKQSARSRSGADAYFTFAVTTPITMSRSRRSRK